MQLLLENKELKPKALFADAVSASNESILIGQLAKLIRTKLAMRLVKIVCLSGWEKNEYLIKKGERYQSAYSKINGSWIVWSQRKNNY